MEPMGSSGRADEARLCFFDLPDVVREEIYSYTILPRNFFTFPFRRLVTEVEPKLGSPMGLMSCLEQVKHIMPLYDIEIQSLAHECDFQKRESLQDFENFASLDSEICRGE